MAKVTLALAGILVALGVISFVATGSEHYTALIPAGFGIVFGLLGAVAQAKPALRKHVMHAAVLIALLGFFGTIGGVVKLIKWGGGTEPARPGAVIAQAIMAGLMVGYIAMCVQSFIAARRARTSGLAVEPR